MGESVIPLADLRASARALPLTPADAVAPPAPLDRRGRPLRDLRISVTDRCNFRCGYCMPKEVFDRRYRFLPHSSLLSFEEIARVAQVFAGLGVTKLRLTGGEPLLRKRLDALVAMLAPLRTPAGAPLDLTLTTNGSALAHQAPALRAAGLARLTVSLDAIDDATFRRMNDVDFPLGDVLRGIDGALAAGFGPVKINMVVRRGTNDDQIVPLARHVRETWGTQAILRFIEFMAVGSTNGWRMDEVLPSAAARARLAEVYALDPLPPNAAGETAERWRYRDGRGEVGFVSSVTRAFCSDCNRARLSTEGKLFLCLFAQQGHDLRALLRSGASDAQLAGAIAAVWSSRDDRYSELRGSGASDDARAPRVEMHYIGG
jgi:cyclic pyranopterin phosphate synthase